jgi:nucleoside-diphosphate-sugar epimerase
VKVLVLGGTHFVGRAVVEDALARGWTVTMLNRGRSPAPASAEALVGDRTRSGGLAALGGREWDVVVDTWSGAPRVVRESAALLADHAGAYLNVSSRSVYAWPPAIGADEDAPTVAADPDADATDYAADKRGAELAVDAAFGERRIHARAGLILGPHEDVGRLPWWLLRMQRGGDVLAPGTPDQPLQLIDARDLAHWLLEAWQAGHRGVFNAVSRTGHATMGSLLDACRDVTGSGAELVWVPADEVLGAGIEPWTELPIWMAPGTEGDSLHHANVERAYAAGLRPRPIENTVADTWTWLQNAGLQPPQREDRPPVGLAPEREETVIHRFRQKAGLPPPHSRQKPHYGG